MQVPVRTAAFQWVSQCMVLSEQLHSNGTVNACFCQLQPNGTVSACFCQNSCIPVRQPMQVPARTAAFQWDNLHVFVRTAAFLWDSQCMFLLEQLHSNWTVSTCFCWNCCVPMGQSVRISVRTAVCQWDSQCKFLSTATSQWDNQCMFLSEQLQTNGTVSACLCQKSCIPVVQSVHVSVRTGLTQWDSVLQPMGQSVHASVRTTASQLDSQCTHID